MGRTVTARRSDASGSRSRTTQPPRCRRSRMPVTVAGGSPARPARAGGLRGPGPAGRSRQGGTTVLTAAAGAGEEIKTVEIDVLEVDAGADLMVELRQLAAQPAQ